MHTNRWCRMRTHPVGQSDSRHIAELNKWYSLPYPYSLHHHHQCIMVVASSAMEWYVNFFPSTKKLSHPLILTALIQIVISAIIGRVDAVPAIMEENQLDIDFTDDWDYRGQIHNEPLLKDLIGRHSMPPSDAQTQIDQSSRRSMDQKLPVNKEYTTLKQSLLVDKKIDLSRAVVSCPLCKLGVGLLQAEVKRHTPFVDIRKKFVEACVGFHIESEAICTGIFDTFGPDVVAVLQKLQMGPPQICSLLLGDDVCDHAPNPDHEWNIELSEMRPASDVLQSIQSSIDNDDRDRPTIKVLQLSDMHFDSDYEAGSPSNCMEPLCCHGYSTPHKRDNVVPAGKWGSYGKCDAPRSLIENALDHIAKQHPDIDYIIWTGDLPPHDIWNQSKTSNLEIIMTVTEQMLRHFPNKLIFPAIGNHESVPCGNFAPPWMKDASHGISWLYRRLTDIWKMWLPPTTSDNTLQQGGFYSVLLRPGFRLIAINTNYCHTYSWWLLLNSTDPAQELKWLVYELEAAEGKQEKVHIIGHIPPGSYDCMAVWSKNFHRIVERFQDTITGQFYGHSHADEFEVFYDVKEPEDDLKTKMMSSRRRRRRQRLRSGLLSTDDSSFEGVPFEVAYLGPSLTTYKNHNPAYRIYYVDGDHANTTREVLDHETWTMDLDAANEAPTEQPQWFRLYTARQTYGLSSFQPVEWSNLIQKLANDSSLFETFYSNYYRNSPQRPICDHKCKLEILCDLRSAKSHSRHMLCNDL